MNIRIILIIRNSLIILPALPITWRSSRPTSTAEKKKGMTAIKSIKFILSQINFFFLGHTKSLKNGQTLKLD